MSAGTLIGPQESMRQATALVRAKRAWQRRRQVTRAQRAEKQQYATSASMPLREHPGRPVGKPHGSWIDELEAQHKVILLCDLRCKSRFDHKAADYYMDRRFPYVSGKCDGCREHMIQCRLYIHNSFLSEPNGRIRSGQIWRPY